MGEGAPDSELWQRVPQLWDAVEKAQPSLGDLPEGWLLPSVEMITEYRQGRALGFVPARAAVVNRPAFWLQEEGIDTNRTREVASMLTSVAQSEVQYWGRAARLPVLTAQELGVDVAICVIDTGILDGKPASGEYTPLVNPQVWPSPEAHAWLSLEASNVLPGLYAWVYRHGAVDVRALSPDGQPFQRHLQGHAACLVQHATDHLQGRLFASEALRQRQDIWWVPPELDAAHASYNQASEHDPSIRWPLVCPPNQYFAMTTGNFNLDDFTLPEDSLSP